jgi:hypothetical protein
MDYEYHQPKAAKVASSEEFKDRRADDSDGRSPLKAVRAHCIWCCNESASEVTLCAARRCPLWLLRSGHRPTELDIQQNADVGLHPCERPATDSELHRVSGAVLKAIRRRCMDCSGDRPAEVQSCTFTTCALHPFRLGKNPNRQVSHERKAALLARLHG